MLLIFITVLICKILFYKRQNLVAVQRHVLSENGAHLACVHRHVQPGCRMFKAKIHIGAALNKRQHGLDHISERNKVYAVRSERCSERC